MREGEGGGGEGMDEFEFWVVGGGAWVEEAGKRG